MMCGALAALSLVISTVYPSGGLFIAASMPMVPPAPVRFSTTTCWPIVSDMRSPAARAIKSIAPPGASGTMIRTGLFGQSDACAQARERLPRPAATAPVAAKRSARRFSFDIVFPLEETVSRYFDSGLGPICHGCAAPRSDEGQRAVNGERNGNVDAQVIGKSAQAFRQLFSRRNRPGSEQARLLCRPGRRRSHRQGIGAG